MSRRKQTRWPTQAELKKHSTAALARYIHTFWESHYLDRDREIAMLQRVMAQLEYERATAAEKNALKEMNACVGDPSPEAHLRFLRAAKRYDKAEERVSKALDELYPDSIPTLKPPQAEE